MDQRRPLVIAVAFAGAIVLGVIIGLVTAPGGRTTPQVVPTTAAPPAEVQPAMDPASWEGSRQPGTPHQMMVREQDRLAFSASLAAALRKTAGAERLTAADVVIPQGKLFYGAVEGRDSASDEYWAVGLAQVTGVPAVNPHVWKRTRDSPWKPVVDGPGACDSLPPALFTAWKGRPALCSGA